MNITHPLFERYPLNGKATLSVGEVSMPYHIYAGYGAFIGGTANLDAVRSLLRGEQVRPMQNTHGQALLGIWVCDFTEASLGPHHELQFSIFVSREAVPAIGPHPLSLLAAMLTRPDLHMMCHGLWNNTDTVVAYNRELLSLNARLSESQINRDAQRMMFSVKDKLTDVSILSGMLNKPTQASLRATMTLAGQLGFGRAMRMGRQPWVSMNIVNPLGVVLNQNAVAEAHTKNDVNNIRFFDPQMDSLVFGDSAYRDLGFAPQFVQHMDGFKFVYLNPQ